MTAVAAQPDPKEAEAAPRPTLGEHLAATIRKIDPQHAAPDQWGQLLADAARDFDTCETGL